MSRSPYMQAMIKAVSPLSLAAFTSAPGEEEQEDEGTDVIAAHCNQSHRG